jgi:hypothetical protein
LYSNLLQCLGKTSKSPLTDDVAFDLKVNLHLI